MPARLYQRVIELSDKYMPKLMQRGFPQFYDAREMYEAGKKALGSKDYKLADTFFSRVVKLAPDNPNGWAMYARTLFMLDRKAESLQALQIEAQLRPNGAAAYNDIAQVLASAGRVDEAVGYASKASELGGFNCDSWLYLSRQAVEFQIESAREKIEKFLKEKMPLIVYTDIFISGFEYTGKRV